MELFNSRMSITTPEYILDILNVSLLFGSPYKPISIKAYISWTFMDDSALYVLISIVAEPFAISIDCKVTGFQIRKTIICLIIITFSFISYKSARCHYYGVLLISDIFLRYNILCKWISSISRILWALWSKSADVFLNLRRDYECKKVAEIIRMCKIIHNMQCTLRWMCKSKTNHAKPK